MRLYASTEGLKEVTCQIPKTSLSHLAAGAVFEIQKKSLWIANGAVYRGLIPRLHMTKWFLDILGRRFLGIPLE